MDRGEMVVIGIGLLVIVLSIMFPEWGYVSHWVRAMRG